MRILGRIVSFSVVRGYFVTKEHNKSFEATFEIRRSALRTKHN